MKEKGFRLIAQNKKARYEYFIEDTYEAGLELFGTEVKAIRAGMANIKESHAVIRDGEVFIYNMHIGPYEQGNINNKDPLRARKLLLHKSEIRKLIGLKQQLGYTLVPLKLYFSGSKVKLEIALAKGKKNYDKRHDIASKDATRRMARAIRQDRE